MLMPATSSARPRRLDAQAGLLAYEVEAREDPGVTSFAGRSRSGPTRGSDPGNIHRAPVGWALAHQPAPQAAQARMVGQGPPYAVLPSTALL